MKYTTNLLSLFLLSLTIAAAPSRAQFTLQDVLKKASEKAEDLQIIDQVHAAGTQEINFFKAAAYPQLLFSTAGSYVSNSTKAFGVMAGAIPIERFSGMEYNWAAVLSQPLVTFGRLHVVYRMAKTQTKLIRDQKAHQREQFFLGVIQAFNLAVLAQVEADVIEKSLEVSKKFHTTMEVDFQTGGRPKIDWLQAQSFLARAVAEHRVSTTRQEVFLNQLKNIIGMNNEEALGLSLEENMYPDKFYQVPEGVASAEPRATRLKALDHHLALDMVKYEKSRRWPSLDFNGQVTNQYTQFSTFTLDNGDKLDYPDSLDNPGVVDLVNADFFNYKLGLQLNWPLFTGWRTLSSHKKALAYAKIEERKLSKMKKQDAVNLSEARKLIEASAEGVKAAKAAQEASALAYDQAKTDLDGGVMNISQFMDIEKQFKETRLLYYRMKAEELMAHINLKMALGQDVFK